MLAVAVNLRTMLETAENVFTEYLEDANRLELGLVRAAILGEWCLFTVPFTIEFMEGFSLRSELEGT